MKVRNNDASANVRFWGLSNNLEHVEEECSRILRDSDKIDRADGRSNLVTGSRVDIKGNKVGTSSLDR
jgi:hypothetical protein